MDANENAHKKKGGITHKEFSSVFGYEMELSVWKNLPKIWNGSRT